MGLPPDLGGKFRAFQPRASRVDFSLVMTAPLYSKCFAATTPSGLPVSSPRLARRAYRGGGDKNLLNLIGVPCSAPRAATNMEPPRGSSPCLALPPVAPAGQPGATDGKPLRGSCTRFPIIGTRFRRFSNHWKPVLPDFPMIGTRFGHAFSLPLRSSAPPRLCVEKTPSFLSPIRKNIVAFAIQLHYISMQMH